MTPDGARLALEVSRTGQPRPGRDGRARRRIAIVGSGIAGLGAAWLLHRDNDVTVFEAALHVGGHAHTVEAAPGGTAVPVDLGFIVYNERNYPNLTRLFKAIDAPTVTSEMSFAVSARGGQFEYRGSTRGLFLEQPSNLVRLHAWRLARDILRFYRAAPALLASADPALTLGECVARGGYSEAFIDDHLLPMGAAIWSTSPGRMLEFPALSFLGFCANHGLTTLLGRPRWRTVNGGAREYVRRLIRPFADRIHTDRAVISVLRQADGVLVRDRHGRVERFDEVVLAGHANQSLTLLGADATLTEQQTLSAFKYERNFATLHTDKSLMPKNRAIWAGWNYISQSDEAGARNASVTYWMNRLQRLKTRAPLFVSLNPAREPAPGTELHRITCDHPSFDRAALLAQASLPVIQGTNHTWFAGSYCGHGFHEDGLAAGFAVAAALGSPAPWAGSFDEVSPAADVATQIAVSR